MGSARFDHFFQELSPLYITKLLVTLSNYPHTAHHLYERETKHGAYLLRVVIAVGSSILLGLSSDLRETAGLSLLPHSSSFVSVLAYIVSMIHHTICEISAEAISVSAMRHNFYVLYLMFAQVIWRGNRIFYR